MARRNIWEQIWESTEGPTVTVTIPRDHAESLLKVLAASLEEEMPDDDMGDEIDDLDFDGDAELDMDADDDMGMDDMDMMPAGDEDDDMGLGDDDEEFGPPAPKKKGPGRPPGSKNKDKGGEKKPEKKDDKKDKADDSEKKDEAADCENDGFDPKTALGESAWSVALRAAGKGRKRG